MIGSDRIGDEIGGFHLIPVEQFLERRNSFNIVKSFASPGANPPLVFFCIDRDSELHLRFLLYFPFVYLFYEVTMSLKIHFPHEAVGG